MKKQKKEEEEGKRVFRGGPSSSLKLSEEAKLELEGLEPLKTIGEMEKEMEKENYEKGRALGLGVLGWLLIILLPLGFWLLLTVIL